MKSTTVIGQGVVGRQTQVRAKLHVPHDPLLSTTSRLTDPEIFPKNFWRFIHQVQTVQMLAPLLFVVVEFEHSVKHALHKRADFLRVRV